METTAPASKPVMFLNLLISSFQRNNPAGELIKTVNDMINFYLNYTSNTKLNKFRHQMQVQQFSRMQNYVAEEGIHYYRGQKMDRKF